MTKDKKVVVVQSFIYFTTDSAHFFFYQQCNDCVCFRGVCPARSRVLLWQSLSGSLGGCFVPLLFAFSPWQNLCWSPFSSAKALPCLQFHDSCACQAVHPHLCRLATCCFDADVINLSLLIFYLSLAECLGHSFVLKPQYQVEACDTSDLWLPFSRVSEALSDPSLIEASCPLAMKGWWELFKVEY